MAYFSESIDRSSTVDLPIITQRVHKRTWLSTAGATSLVVGIVVVAFGLTGSVEFLSPSLRTGNVATLQSGGDGASYSDLLSLLHMQHWPQIQDTLCPVGVPNTTFGPTLFSVARTQLGITPEDFEEAQKKYLVFKTEHPTREITYRFFHDQFQNATTFTHSTGTLAYIPIWKAANMAIRQWMGKSLADLGLVEDMKTASLFNASLPTIKPSCVVTAVRDPVSHFLSGYNEIEFRRDTITDRAIYPHYYQMPFNTSEERRDRFVQFVTDFVMEDSKGLHGNPFGHVFSMSRILTELDRVGGFLSGYAPSINNLSASFPAFVQKTCHLQQDLPLIHETLGKHTSSQDAEGFYRAAKDVWSEQGGAAKSLCVLHAMDYACWKDLAEGIPKLCQEVFSSTDFITAILGI